VRTSSFPKQYGILSGANIRTALGKIYCKHAPPRLKRITFPLLYGIYFLLNRLYLLISDIHPEVSVYRSVESGQEPGLTVLVAGEGTTSRFLTEKLFPTEPTTIRSLGRRSLWNIPSLDRSRVNMTLIEADECYAPFLTRQGFFAVPEWVLFTMDTSMPLEEILNRARKYHANNLRLIRKHQYTYEAVQDVEKLRLFYNKMYLPYIEARFGQTTELASFEFMEAVLQRGELLLIKRGREYVSGMLIHSVPSTPLMCYLGVKNGDKAYVKEGAVSALYLYSISWAKERDYRRLDYGHCRPFLTDGLFWHKKKWGMRMRRSWRKYRTVYISFGTPHEDIDAFLIKNPMVTVDGRDLKGLLFFPEGDRSDNRMIDAVKENLSVSGLKDFEIVFLSGFDGPAPRT
jgi:hypothetical protein